jgi:hypothetical protein
MIFYTNPWMVGVLLLTVVTGMLWFLSGKHNWISNISVSMFMVVLYVGSYFSLHSILGFPQDGLQDLLGRNGRLYSVLIEENRAIYILFQFQGEEVPRYYRLPYTRGRAKDYTQAQERLSHSQGGIPIQFSKKLAGKGMEDGTEAPSSDFILPPVINQPK